MSELNKLISDLGGQSKIEQALQSNFSWILKSFKTNKLKGSSGWKTIHGKWSAPYPETTGYLIPSLLNGSKYVQGEELSKLAIKQLDFFKEIQNKDGSFPRSINDRGPLVFDTAQILLGLLAIAPTLTKNSEKTLTFIKKTWNWLRGQLNKQGKFIDYNYIENYNPSYYARIAWPLAQGDQVFKSKISQRCKALINRIADSQNENYSFADCALFPKHAPLTHNISYTLRGMWEYALLANDNKLKKQVTKSLDFISELITNEGVLGGTYNNSWEADKSFICATGNGQLALLYLLVYEKSGLTKYLKPVSILLKPLLRSQSSFGLNNGAIPSSIPIWGKYQRFRYTNWTQKFFVDTLMKLLELNENSSIVDSSNKEASGFYEVYRLLSQENYEVGKSVRIFIDSFKKENSNILIRVFTFFVNDAIGA